MIETISNKLLKYLVKSEVINNNDDEREYYQYGIEITISSILNISLVLIIGLITGNLFESIVFLICFVPLRQFTGGYHANSYFRCNLSFCVAFILVLLAYHLIWISCFKAIIISFMCVIVLLTRCPIEHKNKTLSEKKKKINKIMATIFGATYSIISTLMIIYNKKIGILILYTLFLVVMLVIVAIISERIKR